MKEIGEKLKETRESMGISIEEAAEDLKIKPSQLTSIEEGNRDAFKDIFYLKYFIRDYSKYLGLDYESMVDEFNEFVFDYTSKLSIEDIKKATNKNKDNKQVKKISSPYTIDKEEKKKFPVFIVLGLIIIVICIIAYFVLSSFYDNDDKKDKKNINNKNEVAYLLD